MFTIVTLGRLGLSLSFAALAACGNDEPLPIETSDSTIVDRAVAAGNFETLVTAVQVADLVSTLEGDGPFTVFAPTDAAFAALPAGALDALLADKGLLTRVLTYHVVPGRVPAADVVGLSSAPTVNGKELSISVEGGTVVIDDATVTATDIEASNGIIHVIDRVLLPEVVLDIVQTAEYAGSFNTLLAALDATNLTDVLKGAGPFTVFAPTDEAFDALPAGTLDALLADPDALADILLYHVVADEVTSSEVVSLSTAMMANGDEAAISVNGRSVMIDDANVVAVDIEATNGVIHVIDRVILPPTE